MMMQIRIMRGRGVAFMFLDKGSTGNDHDDDGYGGYGNNDLKGSMAIDGPDHDVNVDKFYHRSD